MPLPPIEILNKAISYKNSNGNFDLGGLNETDQRRVIQLADLNSPDRLKMLIEIQHDLERRAEEAIQRIIGPSGQTPTEQPVTSLGGKRRTRKVRKHRKHRKTYK